MKKILTLIIATTLAFPAFASAASFVVTSMTGSYAVGNTVTINISVNPDGGNVYSAMLDAHFTSDIFDVESFTLNEDLLSLKQPGYDALDNTKGMFTKTGGYMGGTKVIKPFGTLVLRTKKVGEGSFTISDNSRLLDANGNDQQKGEQGIAVVVLPGKKIPVVTAVNATSEATSTTVAMTTTEDSVSPSAQNIEGTVSSTNSSSTVATAPSPVEKTPISQLAAVVMATAGENSLILGSIALLLVLIISFYIAHTRNLFAGVVRRFR